MDYLGKINVNKLTKYDTLLKSEFFNKGVLTMKKKLTLLITASILTIAMLGACSSSSTSQANQSSTSKVTTKKDSTSKNTS